MHNAYGLINTVLQDKKQRFYLVSALKDTKVDIKGADNFVVLTGMC